MNKQRFKRMGVYSALAAGMYGTGKMLWKKYPLWKNKPSSVPYLQKRVSKLEKGITGKEWKTHDTNFASVSCTNTGSITMLTAITQGNQSINREGLKIHLQSIKTQEVFVNNASATTASLVRRIIFFDQQQHGTVPSVTDVLESASYLALKEHDKQDRFIIVYDDLFAINANISTLSKAVVIRKYKTFKGRKTYYIGTDATQASQGKGNLYMLLISNQATYHPVLDANVRIRFTD